MRFTKVLEVESIRSEIPALLERAGRPELAARLESAAGESDLAAALGADAAGVASTLEIAAVDTQICSNALAAMDFATALRLKAGGTARAGTPFEWHEFRDGFFRAVDSKGTDWDVAPGTFGWGVTVAQWDRPDWWEDSAGEAKALAEEISARPSFPRESMIEEIPHD